MLAEKPPAILLVDAEAGHAAVAALRDSLTVEAAAKRLAANRQMMDWLILIGHLAPLHQGRGRSDRVSCRIGNPDVDTLLEHLHRIAPAMETVPATWAPMIQATKRARITMHVLLDLMLNGHLQNIGRESGSSGFFVDSP